MAQQLADKLFEEYRYKRLHNPTLAKMEEKRWNSLTNGKDKMIFKITLNKLSLYADYVTKGICNLDKSNNMDIFMEYTELALEQLKDNIDNNITTGSCGIANYAKILVELAKIDNDKANKIHDEMLKLFNIYLDKFRSSVLQFDYKK